MSLEEARQLAAADKVDEAITAAKKALESSSGADQGEALACLLPLQLSNGKITLEDALKTIKADSMKMKKVGSKLGDAAMEYATAQVYLAVGDTDQALKAGLAAQAGFAREGAAVKEAEVLCSVVVGAYISNFNEEKALSSANKALALAQQAQDKNAQARAMYALATARLATGLGEDAVEAATSGLSGFKDLGNKSKEAETQCLLSQLYLANGQLQDAMSAAKDALELAKDLGSGPRSAAAVELLVEANILCSTPEEGLALAEKELALLQNSGKTAGQAEMMSAVIIATTEVKGANAGFDAVKNFVMACRRAGNERGEAKMLHRMATLAAHEDVAMNTAQSALKLAQKIGDSMAPEVKNIEDTLTQLWVAKDKLHKAPTRKYALALLKELSSDLEKRDAEHFQETNKKLNKYLNALCQADFDATLMKTISKDQESAMSFLKENGFMAEENKQEGPIKGHKFRPVPVANLYMGFRIGGLGYGPRYRVTDGNNILHEPGAVAIIELQDCSDDWERELGYSPSLLDGCLQTGASMGH